MLIQGLKITFRIPRPWVRSELLHPVKSVIDTATGYSFPSGHTQSATAFFGMNALLTKKVVLRIACFFMILGVALSRMYLGLHTLQDVATSAILTIIITVIVFQISKTKFTNRIRKIVAIGISLGSVTLLTYSLTLYHQGMIELAYATDSCNSACAGLALALGWYLESSYIQFSVKTQDRGLQILKYVIGIVITVSLKFTLGALLGSTILGKGILNFILILWIMVLYPLIIKKVFYVRICSEVS
jgi:undecaprenyl-diphosphatase